jgi:hypothetical protein
MAPTDNPSVQQAEAEQDRSPCARPRCNIPAERAEFRWAAKGDYGQFLAQKAADKIR